MTSIWIILDLAAYVDIEIEQLDIETAFSHSDLEGKKFMEQHEGFKVNVKEHMVCKLQKSLYCFK